MKLARATNAHDCFRHMTVELTRADNNSVKWNEATTNRSEDIANKTTLTTDRTIACFGIEDIEQHDELSPHYPHLFFIKRIYTDANDIRPIKDTHEIYQFQLKQKTNTQTSQ